jgi:uncharacterized protein YgbK (DUF1537 family)
MLADDLTGACDAGAPFAERGHLALVWLAPEPPPPAGLLILVTASRSLAPDAANDAARSACRRLRALHRDVVFLKIDSTFRGNPGAEIQAVMEEAGFRLAVVSPAFPAMGRTVEEGRLRVAGQPTTLHLASYLAGQGLRRVIELDAGEYEQLRQLACGEPAVVVADASSQSDLERLAGVIASLDPQPLPVGSAGLAMEIAARIRPVSSPAPQTGPNAPPGPVLFVIGSTHSATQEQLATLQHSGAALVSPGGMAALATALRAGRHAVMLVEPSCTRLDEARALPEIVRACGVRAMVLSGGDTALLVLRALPAQGIRLERQIQIGIPLGRLAGGPLDGFPVATKAGGFGGPDALAGCARYLSRLAPLE